MGNSAEIDSNSLPPPMAPATVRLRETDIAAAVKHGTALQVN
jgi:hypothetical protein